MEVHGLRLVASSEILKTLGLPRDFYNVAVLRDGATGPGLLEMDLEETRRAVTRHPWMKEVTVRKAYPNRLVITAVERTPVATVVAANGLYLVADDGVILGPAAGYDGRLPMFLGLRLTGSLRSPQVPGASSPAPDLASARLGPGDRTSAAGLGAVVDVLAARQSTPDPGGVFSDLRAVDFSPAREIVMQFRDVRARFSVDRLAREWQRLLAVRADIERRGCRRCELDLRFPDRVVVRPQRAV